MSLQKAIQSIGLSALAEKINATSQQVSNWRHRGVPVEFCIPIERATNGAVRCEELRPDVDWGYLRATDCQVAPESATEQRAA
jgi:DNA-binding transcriptional regulator YdaS (Cro superfamily)